MTTTRKKNRTKSHVNMPFHFLHVLLTFREHLSLISARQTMSYFLSTGLLQCVRLRSILTRTRWKRSLSYSGGLQSCCSLFVVHNISFIGLSSQKTLIFRFPCSKAMTVNCDQFMVWICACALLTATVEPVYNSHPQDFRNWTLNTGFLFKIGITPMKLGLLDCLIKTWQSLYTTQ